MILKMRKGEYTFVETSEFSDDGNYVGKRDFKMTSLPSGDLLIEEIGDNNVRMPNTDDFNGRKKAFIS